MSGMTWCGGLWGPVPATVAQPRQPVGTDARRRQPPRLPRFRQAGRNRGLQGVAAVVAALGLQIALTVALVAIGQVLPWSASTLIVVGVLVAGAAALAAPGRRTPRPAVPSIA
ncbi:phage holin family protein [Streptomyces sp. NBC_00690]|uniref:phage holin family protein n=1 Tax=Streptomyces sp. NBC_00690 TaxID=2975808 RepID=UPI002E29708A|nr:phage holin family protein [Streptomyces sp. NBC_00690]